MSANQQDKPNIRSKKLRFQPHRAACAFEQLEDRRLLAAHATFMGLGTAPGGIFDVPLAVSADGSALVGFSRTVEGENSGDRPLKWTYNAVTQQYQHDLIGLLPGADRGWARGVSADGQVVVGGVRSSAETTAFRWTSGDGLRGLGDLPGGGFKSFREGAWAASSDGSLIVGASRSAMGNEAFIWTTTGADKDGDGTPDMVGLGDPPGGPFSSTANDVTPDGSVIVGTGFIEPEPTDGNRDPDSAVRWVSLGDNNADGIAEYQIQELGRFLGEPTRGLGVSDNGAVVIGFTNTSDSTVAFRWTEETGIVPLGTVAGQSLRIPTGITANGDIIVGRNSSVQFDASGTALIWDLQSGLRDLRETLVQEFGLSSSLAGWTLHEVRVSSDGSTFAGLGTNPSGNFEAWVARISTDEANPVVTLAVADAMIPEAAGETVLTGSLSAVAVQPVAIELAFSGTASIGTDYIVSSAQMVIPSGSQTGSVTLAALQDALDELDETIVVDITSVSGGSEEGEQQVRVTIVDDDEPPMPDVTLTVDTSTIAEEGGVATFEVGLSEPTTVPVTIDLGITGSATPSIDFTASSTQVVITPGDTAGTVTITAVQDELDETDETVTMDITTVTGGTELGTQQQAITITDDDAPPQFTVSSLTATESGFVARFATDLDPSELNLYDTQTLGLGAADATLVGASTGPVRGSLIVDASLRSVTFVKAGGPLDPDSYTVTLRSGADGFKDAGGQLLDGNGDGTAGDDFNGSFDVAEPAAGTVILSIPDFTRGPGQGVNLPADATLGIPVTISEGDNVRAIDLRISYDPAKLSITGATVGADAPAGATVITNTTTPGLLIMVFFSSASLPVGSNTLVSLQATVPTENIADIYGTQQILDLHSAVVSDGNDNEAPVLVDDSVQLVSYFSDVSGNRRVNAADASQVARFAALIDSGFAGSILTDPILAGDVSGNGRVNAADASLVARFAALIPVPEIPPVPAATAPSGAFRLAALQTPADEAVDTTTTVTTEASIDAHWGNTAFQRRATNLAVTDEWPAKEFNSDDSGTLEHAIDEFFAALDEFTLGSL